MSCGCDEGEAGEEIKDTLHLRLHYGITGYDCREILLLLFVSCFSPTRSSRSRWEERANKSFNADSFPKIEYLKFLLSMLYLVVFTFTEEVPFLKSTLGHLQKIVVLCAEKVKMDGGWKGTGG